MARLLTQTLRTGFLALAIAVCGAALALLVNQLRATPINWWNPPTTKKPASEFLACGSDNKVKPNQSTTISQIAARKLLGSKQAIFVDARNEKQFRKQHIKGALNLPEDNLNLAAQQVIERLLNYDKVIVYCDSRACSCSANLAFILMTRYQLKSVKVLQEGFGGWLDNNYPIGSLVGSVR